MDEQIKICIMFSYDGAHYSGSALQKYNDKTASYDIVLALLSAKIYIENPVLAGRTDKGVSAKNMVASFFVKKIHKMNYAAVIQSHLPSTIIITAYAIVDSCFSARHHCIERHYKYVFRNNYDIQKMRICCDKILQFSNYKNLCKKSEERSQKKNDKKIAETFYNRKLNNLTVTKLSQEYCVMDVKGRSFLYNMVRKIFWLVKNYALDLVDDAYIDKVKNSDTDCGTEAPENLIFYKARYDKDINWIFYNKNKCKLQKMLDEKMLQLELLKIKLE